MESYLQIENLSKRFGDLVLFEGLDISIAQDEKVGLIARNGYGKSTLMNIIAGKEDYQSGSITFRNDITISYLVQEPVFPQGITVLEACFQGDSPVLNTIREYETALQSGDHTLLQQAMNSMDTHDAWHYESRAKQILTQLDITEFDKKVHLLSGGQLKRVALANALINEPQLLIMDEPTNHLDVNITLWLEEWLQSNKVTLLLVTHDRYLLDRVCNRIIEIDDGKAYSYSGDYSYYLEKRGERLSAEQGEMEKGQNLYRKELDWMRRMPCARGTKARFRKEAFYELEERLKKRRDERAVELDVKASYIGKKIFELSNLNKRFGEKIILKDFSYIFTKYEKVGIIGPNGVGKSTFIKMLLGEVEPDSGIIDRGTTLRIGYYSQEGLQFRPSDKVIDVVTRIAEYIELDSGHRMSASQFLQKFLFSPKTQYKYVERLSGGEKRRLYLCTILMRNPNFLILDEPTNDLDIMTLQVLEEYLAAFKGCLMVVSHDRYFMDRVAEHLFVFEGQGKVTDFPSSYSDYMTWQEADAQNRKREAEQSAKQQNKSNLKENAAAQEANTPPRTKQRLSFKEKREMEQIEAELQQLEEEQRTLEEQMNSGTLDFASLNEKSKRVAEIIARTEQITERWLELSELA